MSSVDQRSKRLGDASALNAEIEALDRVPRDQRAAYLHDRLTYAIDEICKQNRAKGQDCFSAQQIRVLKDIAFNLVHILDPKMRTPNGFVQRLWNDYKALGPIKQIGAAVGVVAFVVTAAIGSMSFWRDVNAHGLGAALYSLSSSRPQPAAGTSSATGTPTVPVTRTQP